MANLTAQSPLADLPPDDVMKSIGMKPNAARFENTAVVLEEIPLLGMVRLQGQGSAFCESIESLVMSLPGPGKIAAKGTWRCLWLTPQEWLFVTPAGGEGEVIERLAPALAGKLALATQISDSRLAIAISGSRAVELLVKGCALDLHCRHFVVGQAAVTRFAKVAGLLARTGDECYELYVDRSQAHYIWAWLVDSAVEVGCHNQGLNRS